MGERDLAMVRNARWIGSAELSDGRSLRPHALLRCGELDGVADAGIRAVVALQPAVVLDLRSEHEIAVPHPLRELAAYRWWPFVDAARDRERDPARERDRADLYLGSLDRNGRTVAAAIGEILSAPSGPVIVHCKSGVDRTGMLIALMLDAMGVARSSIVADYLANPTPARHGDGQPSRVMARPLTAETMARFLEHLDAEYGGAVGYLTAHGLPMEVGDTLRDRFAAEGSRA